MSDEARIIAFPRTGETVADLRPDDSKDEFDNWLAVEVADFQCSATYLDQHIDNPESFIAEVDRMRRQLAAWETRLREWADG